MLLLLLSRCELSVIAGVTVDLSVRDGHGARRHLEAAGAVRTFWLANDVEARPIVDRHGAQASHQPIGTLRFASKMWINIKPIFSQQTKRKVPVLVSLHFDNVTGRRLARALVGDEDKLDSVARLQSCVVFDFRQMEKQLLAWKIKCGF